MLNVLLCYESKLDSEYATMIWPLISSVSTIAGCHLAVLAQQYQFG